jgi:hypothetical protein
MYFDLKQKPLHYESHKMFIDEPIPSFQGYLTFSESIEKKEIVKMLIHLEFARNLIERGRRFELFIDPKLKDLVCRDKIFNIMKSRTYFYCCALSPIHEKCYIMSNDMATDLCNITHHTQTISDTLKDLCVKNHKDVYSIKPQRFLKSTPEWYI